MPVSHEPFGLAFRFRASVLHELAVVCRPTRGYTIRVTLEKLEQIDADIWIADGSTVSFLGFPYTTRMAVVRLGDGSLWIWSPIELSDRLKTDLASLGHVRFLVSPNKLHHLFLPQWCSTFPKAELHVPPGLAKRYPTLRPAAELTDTPPSSWADEIDQVIVRGSLVMDEVLFFHRSSGHVWSETSFRSSNRAS